MDKQQMKEGLTLSPDHIELIRSLYNYWERPSNQNSAHTIFFGDCHLLQQQLI